MNEKRVCFFSFLPCATNTEYLKIYFLVFMCLEYENRNTQLSDFNDDDFKLKKTLWNHPSKSIR